MIRWDFIGLCFVVYSVARERYFGGGKRMSSEMGVYEDIAEVDGFFQKYVGSEF